MSEELARQCIKSIVTTAYAAITRVDKDTVKIKEKKDKIPDFVFDYMLMGFEKYAMGENRIRGRGDFKPSMFGEVVNYLIAEAFEEGTILKLKDWVDITNKVVDATVSFDAYFKRFNDIITVAIFREEIKKIVDEYNKKIEEAKSSEETKNAEEVKCECGSVIKKKSMKKHQKTKKHINSLKK